MMNRPRTTAWIMVSMLSLLSLLPGCSPLPTLPGPSQSPTLLTLRAPEQLPEWQSTHPLTFMLEHSTAAATLQSPAILYRRQGSALYRYAFHQWAAPPADLIDQVLQVAIARISHSSTAHSGTATITVIRPEQGLLATRSLQLTLFRLEQIFLTNNSSVVELELLAQWIDRTQGRVLSERRFAYRVPASEANAEGAAIAASNALRQWINDLIAWLSSNE